MSTGFVTFLLYLLVMVDNFRGVAGGTILVSIFFLVILIFSNIVAADTQGRSILATWWERTGLALGVMALSLSLAVVTFVPTRDGAVMVVAGALGYEGVSNIIESERVQAVGGKSVDLLESWLDQQIDEIQSEHEEPKTEGEVQ